VQYGADFFLTGKNLSFAPGYNLLAPAKPMRLAVIFSRINYNYLS
jgi:hypothetical protein